MSVARPGIEMVQKSPEDSGAGAAGPRYPVESVAKAAELLRLFGQHSELRLSDVAQTIGVSPSTAHRLLTTLEASGMISQNTTTRCYEPGPELLGLARALTPSVSRWSSARPALADEELRARYPGEALETLTPRSIRTRTELLAELKQVRRRGWATNFGESEPDVSGVAVAVASRAGEVPFAIAVAAPRSRLAQSRVKAIVAELGKTADLLATACSAT